ncbi:ArnT family glycosyltransferase [Nocardia huaxiensis]|uniref:ArnT family glycosyltransferase n=1 Tax=Nocardia huaxiensis TaxID=2755382 RepID=UPI001E5CEE41|nr:ABC transporter [Nocardia huaxiensis]UFS99422.1 ABC transporter [Nocardia huaxiensis]
MTSGTVEAERPGIAVAAGNRRRSRVPRWIFAGSALLYLTTGTFLTAGRGYLMGDALSRVSATESALFSRDPHLSAIGFVFTPLTSLAQLPFVAFEPWFPGITRWGLSGVLMTSLFMAGAVVMIWGVGTDRGAPAWLCGVVTAAFALNPMVIFYGGNGMSEALFLFCLCWAVRRLMRWVRTDGVHDLVACGLALGLGYLTRYDALAPAAVAGIVVFVLSYRRRRAEEHRFSGAAMDLVLVAAPSVLAFVVWAGTSWLITGQAFQQFTSQYGNTAILAQSGAQPPSHPFEAVQYSIAATLILAPALPLLLPITGALAVRRRDPVPLVPMLLCGSVLGFQALSYASGSTFAFLRFYVAAIPLTAILAFLLIPARGLPPSRRLGEHAEHMAMTRERTAPSAAASAVAVSVLLLASLPITARGMDDQLLAVQEYAVTEVLFPDPDNVSDKHLDQARIAATFSTERRIADHLDAMDLPPGSIVMDTVYGFAVQVASKHPQRFVIPSDRDFVRTLNAPAEHGVIYLLTVPNTGRGTSDALNRRYPTIYENGAQIATLALEIPNDGAGQPNWRLYRVIGS